MVRPINPKSLRQLAIKNGIHRETVAARLKRGVDKIDAFILENQRIKVTLKQVIEVEKLGLTITRSAILLNITQARLSQIIKKHKINWRGKREYITRRG
jgi:plasmid maintenance system antidote protein VapI